jgi:hypothetical protein
VDVIASVWGKTDNYPGTGADSYVFSTLDLSLPGTTEGRRRSGWSPAAWGSVVAGVDITCQDHEFSIAADPEDWARFAAADVVRIYRPGNEAAAVTRTVQAVAAGVITTTVACGLAAPVVVTPAPYTTAVAAQRITVFMSDGAGILGADNAFEYV